MESPVSESARQICWDMIIYSLRATLLEFIEAIVLNATARGGDAIGAIHDPIHIGFRQVPHTSVMCATQGRIDIRKPSFISSKTPFQVCCWALDCYQSHSREKKNRSRLKKIMG